MRNLITLINLTVRTSHAWTPHTNTCNRVSDVTVDNRYSRTIQGVLAVAGRVRAARVADLDAKLHAAHEAAIQDERIINSMSAR